MKFSKLSLVFALLLFINACKKDNETEPDVIPETNDTIFPPVVLPDSLREDNMLMGNPSSAVTNIVFADNYLMTKSQFTLSYNNSKGTPNWVSWHLSTGWKGTAPRCNCFNSDSQLPFSFYHTTDNDYNASGFDRGHLCPSNDRDKTSNDNAVTFLMTNIIPQAPNLNQSLWNTLETYCETVMNAGNELYIVSGGIGSGGTGSLGGITYTLANGNVNVPSHCWKVIVIVPVGSNDLARVGGTTRVIAVNVPNTQTANLQPWGDYRISVDSLETLTGYNFISAVTDSIQDIIELNTDNGPTQ
jgi:endonuclease G, mitochondrial